MFSPPRLRPARRSYDYVCKRCLTLDAQATTSHSSLLRDIPVAAYFKQRRSRDYSLAGLPQQRHPSHQLPLFKPAEKPIFVAGAHDTQHPDATPATASYVIGNAPTDPQLKYADKYFVTARPELLHSTEQFRCLPRSDVPEVAFIGRSNVGKSSLLNALLNRPHARMAHVSKKAGRTRTMNAYGLGGAKWTPLPGIQQYPVDHDSGESSDTKKSKPRRDKWETHKWTSNGGVVVLDMPGYGHASRSSWGEEILKYLKDRKQLRRIFVLVDSMHFLKPADEDMLTLLSAHGLPHQILLTKLDRCIPKGTKKITHYFTHGAPALFTRLRADLKKSDIKSHRGAGRLQDIIATSTTLAGERRLSGVNHVRWAVLSAAGLDCYEDGKPRSMSVANNWVVGDGFEMNKTRMPKTDRPAPLTNSVNR